MFCLIGGMNLPADDLAAVQIHDQIQVEPLPLHVGGQVGHVPAPHLSGGAGYVRRRRSRALRRTAAPTVTGLSVGTQHALKARFAGKIDALVGQRGDDARRGLVGETGLVGQRLDPRPFFVAERMRRLRTLCQGPAVPLAQSFLRFPALQGAQRHACDLAGRA